MSGYRLLIAALVLIFVRPGVFDRIPSPEVNMSYLFDYILISADLSLVVLVFRFQPLWIISDYSGPTHLTHRESDGWTPHVRTDRKTIMDRETLFALILGID